MLIYNLGVIEKMMPIGTCPACGRRRRLTRHHIHKFAVFHNDDDDNIIYLCEECHNTGKNSLEELIRQRENEILRQFPELYTKALRDYLNGVRPRSGRHGKRTHAKNILCTA